jgi:replication-associated recombination protein RarA
MRRMSKSGIGKPSTLAVVMLVLALNSNASVNTSSGAIEKRQEAARIEVYDALRIAVGKLRQRKLLRNEEYKLYAHKANNKWVFWFEFLPAAPGEHVIVFVDGKGRAELTLGK